MAFTSGTTAVAFDTLIEDEEIGVGDGGSSYVFTILEAPAYIAGAVLDYQVNGVDFQATSDASGNFTGTHITTATMDETEVTIELSSNALATDEFVLTYTAKGVMTKLLEFLGEADQHEEIIDVDGGASSYSGTLANTGVALGQAYLFYAKDGFPQVLKLTSLDVWEHDDLTTATLNRTTGAYNLVFTGNVDAETVKIIYSVGSAGQDWLVFDKQLSQDKLPASDAFPGLLLKQCVLANSGSSGDRTIYWGIREAQSVPNSYYTWDLNGYKTYTIGGDWNQSFAGSGGHGRNTYDTVRESYSNLPRMNLNDDNTNYRFYATKNRVFVVCNITGDRDVTMYAGNYIPYGPPSDLRYPLAIIGSCSGNLNFTSTSSNHSFIIEPTQNSANFLCVGPDDNFRGSQLPSSNDRCMVLPKGDETALTNGITRTENNKVVRLPCVIYEFDNDRSYGELEEIFYCPDTTIQSDSTFDSGTYRIFQNVFRNTHEDFACVKEN